MAVSNAKKIVLVLGILAAAFGVCLAIHFSGNALILLEKCLATSVAYFAGK